MFITINNNESGKVTHPHPRLRFVEREVPIDETTSRLQRILQQLWTTSDGKDIWEEWKDVPLEKE